MVTCRLLMCLALAPAAAGGFLVYDNDVPPHLLAMAGPRTGMVEMNNTLGHWDLVNHQLRQVWAGLVVIGVGMMGWDSRCSSH